MITTACRVYRFNAAHHLNDGSQCERMHGHNYELHVKLRQESNRAHRSVVMMFDEMDKLIQPTIDLIDHRLVVGYQNIDNRDPYFMAMPENCFQMPTDIVSTEAMAEYFAGVVKGALVALRAGQLARNEEPTDVILHSVVLWETPRNYAEVFYGN